jgi:hypothetical protein
MSDEHPISYLALEPGTPVKSAEGSQFGTVAHVLQLPEEDLFDGIVVRTHHGLRFVDRDQIAEITTAAVHTQLSDTDVAELPAPQGTPDYHVDPLEDTGSGLSARLGRLFGREHWMRDQ